MWIICNIYGFAPLQVTSMYLAIIYLNTYPIFKDVFNLHIGCDITWSFWHVYTYIWNVCLHIQPGQYLLSSRTENQCCSLQTVFVVQHCLPVFQGDVLCFIIFMFCYVSCLLLPFVGKILLQIQRENSGVLMPTCDANLNICTFRNFMKDQLYKM